MATEQELERLADTLNALSMNELLDVLRRVLPRQTDQLPEGLYHSLALADVNWGNGLDSAGRTDFADLEVAVVAWPDRAYYDGGLGPDQRLWEDGKCKTCEMLIASSAKRAFCPICGSRCELT